MKSIMARLKNKVFLRFLLSYILVLFIPILINMQTHRMFLEKIKKFSIESNTTKLTKIMEEIDDSLKEVTDLTLQLSNDRTIQKLMNSTKEVKAQGYLDYINAMEGVYNYVYNKNLITGTNCYILFKNSGYIMTPGTIYPPELYYTSLIRNYQSDHEGFGKWFDYLNNNHFSKHYIYSNFQQAGYPEVDQILYIQTIPIRVDNRALGTFVVEFDKSSFRHFFDESNFSEQGYAYIADENGNIILSVGEYDYGKIPLEFSQPRGHQTFKVDGENIIAAYVISEANHWRYVTLLPESVLYAELNHIQSINYLLFALIIFIGIVTAVLLTNNNSEPIMKVTSYIKDYFSDDDRLDKNDPYQTISTGISQLISNQIAMEEDLIAQKPYIRNSFLNNLISGRFYGGNELYAMAKYLDINLEGEGFYVAVVRIYNDVLGIHTMEDNIEENYIWKSVVMRTFSQYFDKGLLMHDIDKKRIALIFNLTLGGGDREEFTVSGNATFKSLNAELIKNYNMGIFIGISSYCHTANDIWRSYDQAEQALVYAWDESNIAWYDKISATDTNYYYPPEIEQRLINLSKVGDYSQVEEGIDIIYFENFVRRKLSIVVCRELFVEMRSTFSKLLPQMRDHVASFRIKDVGNKANITENFEEIKSIYRVICDSNINEKNDNTRKFIDSIREYIDKNYPDSKLGLYKISSDFNLSEGYFSSVFKEQMGVNFTDYLEKVRLDKSIELLKNSNDTIDTIALTVGYNSAQSYRRAFKKIHSCSPNVVRNAVKRE